MDEMHREKAALRRKMREIRKKLTTKERAEWDSAIFDELTGLSVYLRAETIFCYVSIGAEPDTRRFIAKAIADGKKICVPRCVGRGAMNACKINALEELCETHMGLLEPTCEAEVVPPQEVEFMVAPCLCAGQNGERLGNGGGYYDRYLQNIHCALVCLCYETFVQPTLPMGGYDAYMDAVISESKIYYRGLAKTFL